MSQGPIIVYCELSGDGVQKLSLELLGQATKLAGEIGAEVYAVILGNNLQGIAGELARADISRVYVFDSPDLELYQPLLYTRLVTDLIRETSPEIVLCGATSTGADLAARVAARLETGLTAHCVDLYFEEHQDKKVLVQAVPGWGGNFMVKIICPEKRPQMATVRAGVFAPIALQDTARAEIIKQQVDIVADDFKVKTVEVREEAEVAAALETAEVVVCGGWGVKTAGCVGLLNQLSDELGGATAGTRPLVDAGIVEESRMIGVSGKTVAPKLFVSAGASGAPHYTTGFTGAHTVLAVDKNEKAPIFDVCDVGIVGDLREVLPLLIKHIEEKVG